MHTNETEPTDCVLAQNGTREHVKNKRVIKNKQKSADARRGGGQLNSFHCGFAYDWM